MLKQKIKIFLICLTLLASAFSYLFSGSMGYAAVDKSKPFYSELPGGCKEEKPEVRVNCLGKKTAIGEDCKSFNPQECVQGQTFFKEYVQPVINFLSALVAVAIVGSIIWGGIQYITAGDKPETLGAAKKRITTSLIAFLMFILLFSFIQFLIPGGIF
jgi:hypothetical protein